MRLLRGNPNSSPPGGVLRATALSAIVAASLLTSCSLAGCGAGAAIRQALGMDGEYLLYGFDAITEPGRPANVRVRLQKGSFLNDQEGRLIELYRDDELVSLARTDDEGIAHMTFTPPEVGDYRLDIRVLGQLGENGPGPADVLVACRRSDEPICVVDIDRTLVTSPFSHVLSGDAQPMRESVRVMHRLAEEYTIIYLTLRLDYFGPTTKSWLEEHDYPTGPLWVSQFRGLLAGNRDFRTEQVRRLRRQFPRARLGIGDKISDAEAYLANEMTAILIVRPETMDEADDCRKLADALEHLPACTTHVVRGWREVERIVFHAEAFPPGRVAEDLRRRAEELHRPQR